MNITQYEIDCIVRRLKDDAPDFLESLADAEHHLQVAINILTNNDQNRIRELVNAHNEVYELLGMVDESLSDECEGNDDEPKTK